jgi:predicted solute-binding protein
MLEATDAALIIGDPALRIDPEEHPFEWLDLAGEWRSLTHLPMVFAAWAGYPGIPIAQLHDITVGSCRYGSERLDDFVAAEAEARGISRELASHYLREHIKFELGPREQRGMEAFLELAGLDVCPTI